MAKYKKSMKDLPQLLLGNYNDVFLALLLPIILSVNITDYYNRIDLGSVKSQLPIMSENSDAILYFVMLEKSCHLLSVENEVGNVLSSPLNTRASKIFMQLSIRTHPNYDEMKIAFKCNADSYLRSSKPRGFVDKIPILCT